MQLKNWASVITKHHQNWAPGPNSNGCCQNGNPFCLSNILTSSIEPRVECLEVCSSPSSWSSTSVRSCPAQKVFLLSFFVQLVQNRFDTDKRGVSWLHLTSYQELISLSWARYSQCKKWAMGDRYLQLIVKIKAIWPGIPFFSKTGFQPECN